VGAGDLRRPRAVLGRPEAVGAFREAGRALFEMAIVTGSEGNLSTFDGAVLRITRTGSELGSLADEDVLEGPLDHPPAGSSSDLDVHRRIYRERGPGAVAHAHPPGTVPDRIPESGAHGVYAFGRSLAAAVAEAGRQARESSA